MANHDGIFDTGTHFQIVPNTRKIVVPSAYKVIGTVGDHNSEQLTFMCPKVIDGHNVVECKEHFITWKNTLGEVGHDELQNITEDGENFYFTWTIRDKLAASNGIVSFSVHFEDETEDGELLYRWSTAPCTECEILDSVNALVATYKAIYVSGDKLVIADYTPVTDGTAKINTAPPQGTVTITENGTHDIGEFATAEVKVIDDPDLIPENIKGGVNIFGVGGKYEPLKVVRGEFEFVPKYDSAEAKISCLRYVDAAYSSDGMDQFEACEITLTKDNPTYSNFFVLGSFIVPSLFSNKNILDEYDVLDAYGESLEFFGTVCAAPAIMSYKIKRDFKMMIVEG